MFFIDKCVIILSLDKQTMSDKVTRFLFLLAFKTGFWGVVGLTSSFNFRNYFQARQACGNDGVRQMFH